MRVSTIAVTVLFLCVFVESGDHQRGSSDTSELEPFKGNIVSQSIKPRPFRIILHSIVDWFHWLYNSVKDTIYGYIYYWKGIVSKYKARAGIAVDSFSYMSVHTRISKAMEKVNRVGAPILTLVDAFVEGMNPDFLDWIPSKVFLPEMKMRHTRTCMYGTGGTAENFHTIYRVGTAMDHDDDPLDQRINILVKYKVQNLNIQYLNSQTFPGVKGMIRFNIKENEIEFGLDIPNLGALPLSEFPAKCLVIVRGFRVNELKQSTSEITSRKFMKGLGQKIANRFMEVKEHKFKNILQLGAVRAFLQALEPVGSRRKTWICKSKMFEESLKQIEEEVKQQAVDVPAEKYCEKTPKAATASNQKEQAEIEQELINSIKPTE